MRVNMSALIIVCVLRAAFPAQWCDAGEQEASVEFLQRSLEIKHPIDSNIVVRVVSASREGWGGVGKAVWRGLYVSKDGGRKWKNINQEFDFDGAFYIHPLTGQWFAGVQDTWLKTDSKGFVATARGYKIIISDNNGEQWRDITGGDGHVIGVPWFNQDPDVPRRTCVFVAHQDMGSGHGVVLQAVDDKYSTWRKVRDDAMSDRFAPKRDPSTWQIILPTPGSAIEATPTNRPAAKDARSANGDAPQNHEKTPTLAPH